MKVQSPSKFLNRPFLRSLVENRFLSPSGREYDEGEVRDLLNEKETRLAEMDFRRELNRMKPSPPPEIVRAQITHWQDSIFQSRARESAATKNQSSDYAPTFFNSETIFSLPEAEKKDFIPTQQGEHRSGGSAAILGSSFELKTRRSPRRNSTKKKHKGKRVKAKRKPKMYMGYPVLSVTENYPLEKIRKDLAKIQKMNSKVKETI